MDLASDLAYNRELFQLRDSQFTLPQNCSSLANLRAVKSSLFLKTIHQCSFFATVMQVGKRFPLLFPLQFLFLPPSIYLSVPRMLRLNRQAAKQRIENRGCTRHPDYLQVLCPDSGPITASIEHIEQVAGQLVAGGYDPTSNVLYATIYYLLKEQSYLERVASEIRGTFTSYDEISPDALVNLTWLNVALQESLRLHAPQGSGMPRISPGALIDGQYIPKGVSQSSSQSCLDSYSRRSLSKPPLFL